MKNKMRKKIKLQPLAFVLAGMALVSTTAFAGKGGFIEPPMVSIPAGVFSMGSEDGSEDEKPVRQVSVPAFQMGKYEVTVAEFRKFIAATNYEMPDNCYQHVLTGLQERGSWDNNIYNFSDYHPVVCLTRQAAVDYAIWLSEQTGKKYRLPTEAEWEYSSRAGTSSRFFWGDASQASKACKYANISDWYAADKSKTLFPGANVRDIEQCSDNEATLAVVGLYQPNQFGVYDLTGNVMEYLADCYVDSYENAPLDGSMVTQENCDAFVVRGGSWHWFPWYSSQRSRIPNDFLGALEGFRLVLDTGGKELPAQSGSKEFVKNLAVAQAKVKAQHKKNPAYPNKPQDLKVVAANRDSVKLSWQANTETFLTGYQVYRQDPLTNQKVLISKVIKSPNFIDESPLAHNARYSVIALNGETESQSNEIVDSGVGAPHALPAKIQGEAFSHAVGADVRNSVLEPEDDRIIASLGDNKAVYHLQVTTAGKFQLDARVFHSGQTQKFELWLNGKKFANPTLEGERGWKTVDNIIVDLPQGTHTLIVKGEQPMFAVNWMDVKAVL
ncbi:SUMF1/EgtB/PvdO family nonheme iron enzyme [Arsukibacterium ikkense]|uniref:SUMF1/EgtB/PvdO family nonheme iron enzyme n=1 Tax=Arsukibacterium ikkense TaxID=336831 RepID=UPI0006994395|nr:SUMF1/EgtB/PvdO family nonheme iron enzyme [Arsukibacterium ikkense]